MHPLFQTTRVVHVINVPLPQDLASRHRRHPLHLFTNGCPDVANSLFNLAIIYEKKEEWEKVVDCYQQVYNIESKIFGQDHTQVKETLEALNEAKQNLE